MDDQKEITLQKEKLYRYFNRYARFSKEEINCIHGVTKLMFFPKKSFLVQEGEYAQYRFFVLKGLVRTFTVNEKGHEQITQFAIENWWIMDFESVLLKEPAQVYLQAIEDTQCLGIKQEQLEALYLHIPQLESAFRQITERILIAHQRRHNRYLKLKSKERYRIFTNLFPEFAQRVPQYMIASYLEISPEYLSTIRKEK
ncbi:MAG: Crp/Fnr family transcriptional regulator [Bacteroidota bacterium]